MDWPRLGQAAGDPRVGPVAAVVSGPNHVVDRSIRVRPAPVGDHQAVVADVQRAIVSALAHSAPPLLAMVNEVGASCS